MEGPTIIILGGIRSSQELIGRGLKFVLKSFFDEITFKNLSLIFIHFFIFEPVILYFFKLEKTFSNMLVHHEADKNSLNSCQLIPIHYMTNIKLKRVEQIDERIEDEGYGMNNE